MNEFHLHLRQWKFHNFKFQRTQRGVQDVTHFKPSFMPKKQHLCLSLMYCSSSPRKYLDAIINFAGCSVTNIFSINEKLYYTRSSGRL